MFSTLFSRESLDAPNARMAENEINTCKAELRRRWIEKHRTVLNRTVAAMVAIVVLAVLAACYVVWGLMAVYRPPG